VSIPEVPMKAHVRKSESYKNEEKDPGVVARDLGFAVGSSMRWDGG